MSNAPVSASRTPRAPRRPSSFHASETARPDPARGYERTRDLPRLLPLIDPVVSTASDIVAALGRALRIERARAAAGHGSYDPRRHAALGRALLAERGAEKRRRRILADPAPRRDDAS